MNYINTLAELQISNNSILVKKLDELKEYKLAEKLQSVTEHLHKTLSVEKNFKLVKDILLQLNLIEVYDKIFSHPVNINEFKDKHGNVFLQARASIKISSGKLKWISAYIGSIKDFPDGVNDINAYEKGQGLIRKKLLSFYFSEDL